MIERKNYGITPLCESGKGKFISGAAAQRGHGFHTQPYNFHIEILRSAEIRLASLCLTSHQQLIKSS